MFAWLRVSLVIIALSALAGGAASAQTLKPVKIGIAVPDSQFMTVFVAEDQGFFKAEGLDVQLVQFDSDTSAAQAATANAVDMVNSSIFPVLDAYVAGRDLTAIWGAMNQPVYTWYGPAKFNSIKDIKGGRIGVSSVGSISQQISAWAVLKSGLDPKKDVTYIALGGPANRAAALQAGQVDLIPATAPSMYLLEQQGFKPLLDLATLIPEVCQEVFYTKKANLDKNTETLRAVIRASIHAKHWALAHPEEANKSLISHMGGRADQEAIYLKTTKLVLPYFPDDGHFPAESINIFLEFYKDMGKLKEIPPISAFTDSRFIEYFKQNPVKD